MNITKMRKNLARNVPDQVWRTFGAYENNFESKYHAWRDFFGRQMKIKHGDKLREFSVYQTNDYDNDLGGLVRIQLMAVLWR